jgi:hypothetical protein
MTEQEPDEPELIAALFEKLRKQPLLRFTRGCRDVPDENGVYVIYGPVPWDIRYVGRTDRTAPQRRPPFWRGLRRRLSKHGAKYGPQHCYFRYLVVLNARQRALLESLATGMLCPTDLGTGEKEIA